MKIACIFGKYFDFARTANLMNTKLVLFSLVSAIVLSMSTMTTQAAPMLQLYIEAGDSSGGNETYFEGTSNADDPETWVRVGDSDTPFRVWAVAKTQVGSKKFNWTDIRFVASFNNGLTPALDWNPITGEQNYSESGYNTSTPTLDPDGASASIRTGVDNDPWDGIPNAPNWPHHGQFGEGRTWVEWNLGQMLGQNTLIGDFQPDGDPATEPFFGGSNFPTQSNEYGAINVYELFASGLAPGDSVHFDLWGVAEVEDCKGGKCEKYKVNAFSHDARWEQAQEVPTPGALLILSIGMLGLAARRNRIV